MDLSVHITDFPLLSCFLGGSCCLVEVMSDSLVTLWTVACQAPRSVGFPSKNTGVGCH